MRRPSVLLADDHAIVAQGIGRLLEERFELVGIAVSGTALVDLAKRHLPDVIVSDIAMPGMSGLEALRILRREGVGSSVVFLTMHADAEIAAEALRCGASGFVLKNSAGDELLTAIARALEGHVYLTPGVADGALESMARTTERRFSLTPRQREVLRLTAEGRRVKEIAAILGVSTRTVESHKYEMMEALGARTTADLIRYAVRHGVVTP